jgi:hypothetical protein
MNVNFTATAAAVALLTAAPAFASVIQLNFSGSLEESFTANNHPSLIGATLNYSIMFDTDDAPLGSGTYATQTNSNFGGTANVSITGLSGGAADIIEEDLSVYLAVRNYFGADDIYDIVEFSFSTSALSISNHQFFPGAFGVLADHTEINFLTDGTIDPTLLTNTTLNYGTDFFSQDTFRFTSTTVTSGAVSAVPLPSAILLSMGSLGALAGLRRKKSKS